MRSVEEPDERRGEESSSKPDAIEADSGAVASISGIFTPSCRASSASCCARACSASGDERLSTSRRYWASSKIGPLDSMAIYVQGYGAPSQRAHKLVRGTVKRSGLAHGTSSTV